MVRTSSVVLPDPGAGHQVEGENPSFDKEGAVARGQPVVLGEYILLDAHQPLRLAAAGPRRDRMLMAGGRGYWA